MKNPFISDRMALLEESATRAMGALAKKLKNQGVEIANSFRKSTGEWPASRNGPHHSDDCKQGGPA